MKGLPPQPQTTRRAGRRSSACATDRRRRPAAGRMPGDGVYPVRPSVIADPRGGCCSGGGSPLAMQNETMPALGDQPLDLGEDESVLGAQLAHAPRQRQIFAAPLAARGGSPDRRRSDWRDGEPILSVRSALQVGASLLTTVRGCKKRRRDLQPREAQGPGEPIREPARRGRAGMLVAVRLAKYPTPLRVVHPEVPMEIKDRLEGN